MLGTHTKQSSEKELITVDFANRLDVNETVSTCAVVSILESTGASTTSTIISSDIASGTFVKFYVNAGATGEKHKITVTAYTSNSQILEEDLYLIIKNE